MMLLRTVCITLSALRNLAIIQSNLGENTVSDIIDVDLMTVIKQVLHFFSDLNV